MRCAYPRHILIILNSTVLLLPLFPLVPSASSNRILRREEKPKKLKFDIQLSTGNREFGPASSSLTPSCPTGCDVISFPNATVNQCGYCVGGGTGLPLDHGKDCMGGNGTE